MKINEFDRVKHNIQGTGINTTTTRDKSWVNKDTGAVIFTIPAGSKVHIDFSETFTSTLYITYNGEVKKARISSAHLWTNGIKKAPRLSTMEKYSDRGVAKTVTGHNTEPDGFGPDGSPSWFLALGIM